MLTVDHLRVDRAEALFASSVPTGLPLTSKALNTAIAQTLRARGAPGCAAEMAAAYGENPAFAARRMRWVLGVLRLAAAATAGPAREVA